MDVTRLPEISPEGRRRIAQARKEAQSFLKQAFVELAARAKVKRAHNKRTLKDRRTLLKDASRDNRNTAMLLYLDAIAWEYMCTRSGAEFETLIGAIGEKAQRKFNGDIQAVSARTLAWIDEARDRTKNGIDEHIPLRIGPQQMPIFHDLQVQFRGLPGSGPDFHALFTDGGRKHIIFDGTQHGEFLRGRFDQLARRAMAALNFTFTNPSRTVDYWLDILRQESPHFEDGRISRLCFASAELCRELETRAVEAGAAANIERAQRTVVRRAPRGGILDTKAPRKDPEFLKRAAWLKDQLQAWSWNKHDLHRNGGPDNKTVQKILDGFDVRADVLEKVARALSVKRPVAVLDIPRD